MVSEKITVGLATKDFDTLREFLNGEGIEHTICPNVGANGERYFVVGPMDASYLQSHNKRKFVEDNFVDEYVLLGQGEGDLDKVSKYREEHGCV
ncbi:MAG: hypothetical protein KAT83_03270 [Candidatus Aenigmarchaeota archaeon]|nr:hypothetical protein [Candidatus Aenigmarchaeota archaeon]